MVEPLYQSPSFDGILPGLVFLQVLMTAGMTVSAVFKLGNVRIRQCPKGQLTQKTRAADKVPPRSCIVTL